MDFYFGLLIIGGVLFFILTKRMSALSALIVVPVIGALLAGYGLETADFAIKGIKNIAPIATMFIFAILFFGILTDAGMFDPIIGFILKKVGHDPVKIVIGSAILAMLVHLDGSGAVTFLIAVPAMLPLFDRMKLDRRILACVVGLGAGTMNLVPWGGPTLRAASALQMPVTELYRPLMIPQLTGLLFVIFIAFYLGRREKNRIAELGQGESTIEELKMEVKRPPKFWINIVLTIATIVVLIQGWIAPALVFMLSLVITLTINYPNLKDQKEHLDAHAKSALLMASILLAAGVFIGILTEAGMIRAIAEQVVKFIPESMGRHIPFVVSIFSMPASLIFDPDSYYFGFLPIIAQVGSDLGVPTVSIGHASLLGQMTTGFPLSPLTASTFLLIGLCGIDLADHQRFSFGYAFLTTLVMSFTSIIVGLFPL